MVIVDGIQKDPDLQDALHRPMPDRGLHFILSGSSARKLRKSGANTRGGRAKPGTGPFSGATTLFAVSRGLSVPGSGKRLRQSSQTLMRNRVPKPVFLPMPRGIDDLGGVFLEPRGMGLSLFFPNLVPASGWSALFTTTRPCHEVTTHIAFRQYGHTFRTI